MNINSKKQNKKNSKKESLDRNSYKKYLSILLSPYKIILNEFTLEGRYYKIIVIFRKLILIIACIILNTYNLKS